MGSVGDGHGQNSRKGRSLDFFRKHGFYWFLLNIPRTEVVISGEGSTRCTTAVMESWKEIRPQAEVAAKDLVRFWPTIWCSIMGYQPCESTVTWHNTSELLRWRRFASFLWGGESWTAREDQNGQNLLSLFTVKNQSWAVRSVHVSFVSFVEALARVSPAGGGEV